LVIFLQQHATTRNNKTVAAQKNCKNNSFATVVLTVATSFFTVAT